MADTIPPTVDETVTPTEPTTPAADPDIPDLTGLLDKPAPAEPAEEPAQESLADEPKPEDTPAEPADEAEAEPEPAAPAPAPAQPDPAIVANQQAWQAHEQRVAKYDADLAAQEAALAREDHDPYSAETQKESIRLQREGRAIQKIENDGVRSVLAQQQFDRQFQSTWDAWGRENGIPATRGQEILGEEYGKLQKLYPGYRHEALEVLAQHELAGRVKLIKGQAAAKAAKSPPPKPVGPPITPGGGRIVPAVAARPASAPKTPGQEFDAKYAADLDKLLQ